MSGAAPAETAPFEYEKWASKFEKEFEEWEREKFGVNLPKDDGKGHGESKANGNAVVDPDRLDRAASYHLRSFQAAYGKDMVKPKHHQELHVSDNARKMEERVIDSLKHVEKQHKVVKKHPAK